MKKMLVGLFLLISVSSIRAEAIAEVNGKKISLSYLKSELKRLPDEARSNYESDHAGFLEELIVKEVLLQEIRRLKIDTISAVKSRVSADKTKRDDIVIEELFRREVLPKVAVSEDEMKKFYKDNKGQMQGLTYEQMKPQIQNFILEQKQRDATETYISVLRSKAKIVRNEKWLRMEEAKFKNPINEALKNQRPTMVDFGAGTCLPCIQMKPIIEELQRELKDKANVLLIDVNEERVLTRKHKIMLIPTQIFFNTAGKETYRHVGFYSKDSILVYLEKAGLK